MRAAQVRPQMRPMSSPAPVTLCLRYVVWRLENWGGPRVHASTRSTAPARRSGACCAGAAGPQHHAAPGSLGSGVRGCSWPCPARALSLTPSRRRRSDRRPKDVFYSSTAYTVHSPVYNCQDPIPNNKTQLFPQSSTLQKFNPDPQRSFIHALENAMSIC